MLEQELETARSRRDQDAVHAARIAVKRLRYLLEPLAAERPRAGALAELLKRLQTVLGELHDLQALRAELGVAVAEAAAERACHVHAGALAGPQGRRPAKRTGPRPASAGLLALARFAGRLHDDLFRRLDAEWAGSRWQHSRRICVASPTTSSRPSCLPRAYRRPAAPASTPRAPARGRARQSPSDTAERAALRPAGPVTEPLHSTDPPVTRRRSFRAL